MSAPDSVDPVAMEEAQMPMEVEMTVHAEVSSPAEIKEGQLGKEESHTTVDN
jgi:hypothetical protein